MQGTIVDKFGQPLPQGYWFDLRLDDLTYLSAEVTGEEGQFAATIETSQLYSGDLRDFAGVNIRSSGATLDRTRIINLDYRNVHYPAAIDGLERFFLQYSSQELQITYENLSLGMYDLSSGFEGIKVYIYIPATYNEQTGSTFAEIQIQFNGSTGIGDDLFYYYSVSSEKILELIHDNPQQYIWNDIYVNLLPIEIPFLELNSSSVPFNLSAIHTISIIGEDNTVHPGLDLGVPTQCNQALACGGIFLVDSLNNATIYHSLDPTGIQQSYQSVSGVIQSSILKGVRVITSYSIEFLPILPSLVSLAPVGLNYYYNQEFVISNLHFSTNLENLLRNFPMEYVFLSARRQETSEYVQFAVGMPVGVTSEKHFLVIALPGQYYDLYLEFSGNALFSPFSYQISTGPVVIEKDNVQIDIWNTFLGESYAISLDRNQSQFFFGQLIDANNHVVLNYPSTALTTIDACQYASGDWIADEPTTFSGHKVMFGILDAQGEPYWIDFADVQAGTFNFTINNEITGNFPVAPGTYLCVLNYTGNEFYSSAQRYFSITINPIEVYIQQQNAQGFWTTVVHSFNSTLTYSEDATFSYRVLDGFTNTTLPNLPIWIQIGIVPNSFFSDKLTAQYANTFGDYLTIWDENAPASLLDRYYKQELGDRPVLYPFIDYYTKEYKCFGPLYYQVGFTDGNGTVSFSIDSRFLRNIADKWMQLTGSATAGGGIANIPLYMRVFYAPFFDYEVMKLPQAEYYGMSYTVDFLNNAEWVYDYNDSASSIGLPSNPEGYYLDTDHYLSAIEGVVALEKHDTMLLATYQEVPGSDSFLLCAQVVEATLDGNQTVPKDLDSSNFIESYGLHASDYFHIQMEIYDQDNNQSVVPERYVYTLSDGTEVYSSYIEEADSLGVVAFNCSEVTLGKYWTRMVPNIYNVHYDVVPGDANSFSKYYNLPTPGIAQMVLKSASTYMIDYPSHVVVLADLLSTDANTYVNVTASPGAPTITGDYEPNYPIFSAKVAIHNQTDLPATYQGADEVYVRFTIDGIIYSSRLVANFSDTSAMEYVVEFPLSSLDERTINVSISVDFIPDPEVNINWTLEYNNFLATYPASDVEAWADRQAYLIDRAWQEYQIASNYEVIVSDLKINASSIRKDIPCWHLLDSPASVWTYLNGTTITAPEPVLEVGLDGIRDLGVNCFATDLMAATLVGTQLRFMINKDFAQNDLAVAELDSSMAFNASATFPDLLTVEQEHWNLTASSEAQPYYELYQISDGYQAIAPADAIPDWMHAVRTTSIYNYSAGGLTDLRDGLWVGLYPQESLEMVIDQFYMPYDGFLNWSVMLPKFSAASLAGLNLQVQLTLEELFVPSPNTWTMQWALNDGASYSEDETKFAINSMNVAIPSDFQSRLVRILIKFTLLQADVFTSFVVLDGRFTGSENILRISNVYPSALRARLFSTNFLYYYTNQAFNMGATHTSNQVVDDIYYAIADDGDPYASNLRDIVDMWDWRVYASDRERFDALESWSYLDEEGTYAELKDLFHNNDNKATFTEFSDVDTRGLSIAKMKFNETFLANLGEPARYSGFVQLYRVNHPTSGTPQTDPSAFSLLKTRKVTLLVNPTDWVQMNSRTTITSGPAPYDPATFSASLLSSGINLQYNEDLSQSAALTYYLPASDQDLAINDWSTRIPKINHADPLLYVGSEEGRIFYDDYNYTNYYEMVSGDANWQQWAHLDGTAITVQMPRTSSSQTSFSFAMDISTFYDLAGKQSHYDWLDMPFIIDNASCLTKVEIEAGELGGSLKPIGQYDLADQTCFISEDAQYYTPGFSVEQVRFTVEYNASAFVGYMPNLTLLGMGLYGSTSVATMDFTFAGREAENSPVISARLFPTILCSEISPKTYTYNLSLVPTDASIQLGAIMVTSPARPNCAMQLFDVAVYDVISPCAPEATTGQTYYNYLFDPARNALVESFNRLYCPSTFTPLWECGAGEMTQEVPIPWMEQHTYDYDADGQYDYVVQYIDGEGKGPALYAPGVTYFENAKADTFLYDFNVDGIWDYQEKWDIQSQTYNATPVGSYGTDYYYVTQTQTYLHETCFDSNGDGIFNYVEREYASRSLKSPVPNYREYVLDFAGHLRHFAETLDVDAWSAPTWGILQQYDYDDDGCYDYIIQREDRFQNDPQFVQDNNVAKLYETYSIMTKHANGTVAEERGNTLLQDLTFVLLGPDDISSWKGGQGSCATNISGQFVVVGNVSVPIDPRTSIDASHRVVNNGVLAWYDSEKDGTFEMAFVFTPQSWAEKIAVAVYLSRSGQQKAFTNPVDFAAAGDQIVASHWLSDYYGITDIMDVGYANAYVDFKKEEASPQFWCNWLIDTGASAAIMFVSALTGPFALVVAPALFLTWQYYGRPALMDSLDTSWQNVKSHPLGQSSTRNFGAEGYQNFLTDFSSFHWWTSRDADVAVYDSQASLCDADPFYQDLYATQFDPDGHYALLFENYSVYVEYAIPQFWFPTADNALADWDFVEQIKELGVLLRPQKDAVVALGISAGVPNYFLNALAWYADHYTEIPADQRYQALQQKIHEYEAWHRRVVHQYYYRDAPWGETRLWNAADALRFDTVNQVGVMTATLRQQSQGHYTDFVYVTSADGQPMLVASYAPGMNYSDPVAYEVDYVQMCMQSKYRTAYESGQKYNPEIFWTKFGMELASTVIAVLAGYGGSMRVGYEAPTLASFVMDVVEEMAWENLVSASLQFLGFSEGFAEQIAEMVGLEVVLGRITGSKGARETRAETQEKVQMIQELTLGTTSLAGAQSAARAHQVAAGRPAPSLWQRVRVYVVARLAARVLDLRAVTAIYEKLRADEVQQTQGGARNLAGTVDALRAALKLTATHFPRHVDAKQYQQALQRLLATALLKGGGTAAIFQEIYNDPALSAALGLNDPATGNRFQKFEFTRRRGSDAPCERLVLNPRGEGGADLYRDGQVEFLSEAELADFLAVDLGAFLAQYHVKCVDPASTSQNTVLKESNPNRLPTREEVAQIRRDLKELQEKYKEFCEESKKTGISFEKWWQVQMISENFKDINARFQHRSSAWVYHHLIEQGMEGKNVWASEEFLNADPNFVQVLNKINQKLSGFYAKKVPNWATKILGAKPFEGAITLRAWLVGQSPQVNYEVGMTALDKMLDSWFIMYPES